MRNKDLLPTSMHDRLLDPFNILHMLGTRIVQARLLLNRQRIDVSAQKQRLAVAILEHGGKSVAANMRVDLKRIEGLEVPDDSGGRFLFAEGELGMRVEPFVWSVSMLDGRVV